jgi:hypothetical protein
MTKLSSLLSLCIGIILLSGCSTTKIDLPKGNSEGYTSFRMYEHPSSHILDLSNPEDRANAWLQEALKSEFEANGLKESKDNAELIVAYLLVVQDTAVSTAISDYYMSSGSDILSEAHRRMEKKNMPGGFEAGSIVVDIVDTNTGDLIYRNYASRQILPGLTDKERKTRIDQAVTDATTAFFN